jgi:hypothetical protein
MEETHESIRRMCGISFFDSRIEWQKRPLKMYLENENLPIFHVLSSFHFKIYRPKSGPIQSNFVPLMEVEVCICM